MQKFWIHKNYIPLSFHSKDEHSCMEIDIPEKCQECSKTLVVLGGDETTSSTFSKICDHFQIYPLVWKNRIISNSFTEIKLDPINDGCKCSKCGLWSSMSSANQPDGTFKCYLCRNRGF